MIKNVCAKIFPKHVSHSNSYSDIHSFLYPYPHRTLLTPTV